MGGPAAGRSALKATAAEQPRLGRLESRYYEVRGRRVHARVSVDQPARDRPPIVLVHGLVVSSRYFIPTAIRLAAHFRVYSPDLPGYGRSYKPPRALNVPDLADALAAWMDAAGLPRAHLVANSFGCQIAVDFAVRYPDRVERLVLLGPTVDPWADSPLRTVARWLLNVPLEPLGLDLVVLRDLLDMGPRRTLATMRHMFRDRVAAKLQQVEAPTLVVRGGRDSTVSQRWVEAAARLLRNGRVAVIAGKPHTVNFNAPEAVARVVLDFVA